MARTWAIEAVCETIVGLPCDTLPPEPAPLPLGFRVMANPGLANGGDHAGVSVLLYRMHLDGTERAPKDVRRPPPAPPAVLPRCPSSINGRAIASLLSPLPKWITGTPLAAAWAWTRRTSASPILPHAADDGMK